MKILILSGVLVASMSLAAQAQTPTRFGIKAGISLTGYSGNGSSGSSYQVGGQGGFMASIAVSSQVSVQPELLYSLKGAKGTESFATYSDTYQDRLHYLDVPLLAHVKAGNLFFELGPQVGFLVVARTTLESSGQSNTSDTKSYFNSVDFGYVGGLGYQVAAGPSIGLRYNGGFTNIYTNSNTDYTTHNSAFQLYVSYLFDGK